MDKMNQRTSLVTALLPITYDEQCVPFSSSFRRECFDSEEMATHQACVCQGMSICFCLVNITFVTRAQDKNLH